MDTLRSLIEVGSPGKAFIGFLLLSVRVQPSFKSHLALVGVIESQWLSFTEQSLILTYIALIHRQNRPSVVKKSRAFIARDYLPRAERWNDDWPSAPVVCSVFIIHQARPKDSQIRHVNR